MMVLEDRRSKVEPGDQKSGVKLVRPKDGRPSCSQRGKGPLVHDEFMVRLEGLSGYGRTEMMKDHSGAKGS